VATQPGLCIYVSSESVELALIDESLQVSQSIRVDFASGPMKQLLKSARKSQPLAKAIGPAEWVLDATAGLGKDSFLLAAFGYKVIALEQSPVVFSLLQDGYERGLLDPIVGPVLRERLKFMHVESVFHLSSVDESKRPDVVYLDPMYPDQKKAALPKKEMQLFRMLFHEKPNERLIFEAAINAAKRRVTVKRPLAAPPLAEPVSHSYEGKMVRYDSYLMPMRKPRYIGDL
jgi:16S rRNA (guanine1516-N2)-methyltransferase